MPNRMIVLTGAHGILKNILDDPHVFGDFSHFPSILNDLRNADENEYLKLSSFFDELVMHRELERDSQILSLFDGEEKTVFVDQWHIGNIAWAKVHASHVAEVYENRLPKILTKFSDVEIVIWYMSVDPLEEPIDPHRKMYLDYIGELSSLLETIDLPVESIDSNAPTNFVAKRVSYLLNQKHHNET